LLAHTHTIPIHRQAAIFEDVNDCFHIRIELIPASLLRGEERVREWE